MNLENVDKRAVPIVFFAFLESIFIAKRVSSAPYRTGPTFARETFLLGYLWYAQL